MSNGIRATAPSATLSRRASERRLRSLSVTLLGGLALAACGNDATSGGGQAGIVGEERTKPGSTDTFIVDPNEGGKTRRLRIAEASWGRLVDVHDQLPSGATNPDPVFEDFVIGQDVMSDGVDYELETNPVTLQSRLVILRQKSEPSFRSLLDQAAAGLQPIEPANDDGTASGPISLVPRNATVVLRFNDVLRDDAQARSTLLDDVQVVTGYTPSVPFDARVVFDPNHGAVIGNAFHSSRVLVDMTVSQAEANDMLVPLEVNGIGLPASNESDEPNVSIRIPSRILTGAGQFSVLRSLSGFPIDSTGSDPVSSNTVTEAVVRAFRSGRAQDPSNGFLNDLDPPRILGTWPTLITDVANDPTGDLGFDFLVDVLFTTACRDQLLEGNVLRIGPSFLEVTLASNVPDGTGLVPDVAVRNLSDEPIANPSILLGNAAFLSPFDLASSVPIGCWVTFTPPAETAPTTRVETTSVASLRFNEPMDPVSVTALDTFLVVEGDATTDPTPENITVGIVQASPDLENYTFTPSLPFHHMQGTEETFHIAFSRAPHDLAGNDVVVGLPKVEFTIEPTEPSSDSGGVTFRFNALDEMTPVSPDPENDPIFDVRGQIFHDLSKGTIRPRTTVYSSHVADQSKPVPALMTQLTSGVKEPLVPLGSRLQTVWRYCDFGWMAQDETKHNLDVIGLSWAPVNGVVVGDFFPEFAIRLSHSTRLPDNGVQMNGNVRFPASGLLPSPATFEDNVLSTADTPQRIVHQRPQGYRISPFDRFTAPSGTLLMPYPMNRAGGPLQSFLWRDTGATSTGDPDLANFIGIPLQIEGPVQGNANVVPLPDPDDGIYYVVQPGDPIPTIALPLLMEFRCYPTATAIGLNSVDGYLASTATLIGMRSFSSGGTDTSGTAISRNPDTQTVALGGFTLPGINPGTGGLPTLPQDPVFYPGQIDTVVRVSRAHTIWLDTGTNAATGADYSPAIVEPDPTLFPNGTSVLLDFRGATGFTGAAQTDPEIPRKAQNLDFYGDLRGEDEGGEDGAVDFLGGVSTWSRDISAVDGARYIQVRLTFVNNIDSRLNAEISALGIPFLRN